MDGRNDLVLSIMFICVFIVFPVVLIIANICEDNKYQMYYTYVDLDNNKGIAYKCKYTNNGGMGTPICELEDGTIIAVKQYKFIKESKGE